jgi:hypothetical protein
MSLKSIPTTKIFDGQQKKKQFQNSIVLFNGIEI